MEMESQQHRISGVENWENHGENMFKFEFSFKSETHEMLCGISEDGIIQVSHSELLDSDSEMDEIVMENMAEEFMANCSEYFTE